MSETRSPSQSAQTDADICRDIYSLSFLVYSCMFCFAYKRADSRYISDIYALSVPEQTSLVRVFAYMWDVCSLSSRGKTDFLSSPSAYIPHTRRIHPSVCAWSMYRVYISAVYKHMFPVYIQRYISHMYGAYICAGWVVMGSVFYDYISVQCFVSEVVCCEKVHLLKNLW